MIKNSEGKYTTKFNQPVENISEENFSLYFCENESIKQYKQNIDSEKIVFQPESIKNEVTEYMNQKLFVLIY